MQLDRNGLPLLEQFGEEGFVDCVFQVQHLTQDEAHYHFDLRATFGGLPVGVRARLLREVQPGFDGEMKVIQAHFYSGGLEISSLGLETERFIEALAQLYQIELVDGPGLVAETFSVFALHQADTDLASSAVRLKVFGNDRSDSAPGSYYESFFNVDLPAGHVYWNEKDMAYRTPMLNALAALVGQGVVAA